MSEEIEEFVPKQGFLFNEFSLHPILCKPKLLPMKSVTLEKLEKMQREAQEKVIEMEKQQQLPSKPDENVPNETSKADIWEAETNENNNQQDRENHQQDGENNQKDIEDPM